MPILQSYAARFSIQQSSMRCHAYPSCTLRLLDRDPITQHVAGRIVELAHQGIRTKVGFYLRTLDEFKPIRSEGGPY